MSTPTHTIIGMMLGHVCFVSGLIPGDHATAVLLGAVAGNLPDFDVPFFSMKRNHRRYSWFHVPLYWLVGYTVAWMTVRTARPELLPYIGLFAVGTFSHFLMDMYDATSGIRVFAPFSNRLYSFIDVVGETTDLRTLVRYFFRYNFKVEAIISAVGLLALKFVR